MVCFKEEAPLGLSYCFSNCISNTKGSFITGKVQFQPVSLGGLWSPGLTPSHWVQFESSITFPEVRDFSADSAGEGASTLDSSFSYHSSCELLVLPELTRDLS